MESHEKLSQYWKEEILCPMKPIFQEEHKEIQCGVLFDPTEFIPLYLKRFLMKQEKAGNPLPPGHYEIVMKVFFLSLKMGERGWVIQETYMNIYMMKLITYVMFRVIHISLADLSQGIKVVCRYIFSSHPIFPI